MINEYDLRSKKKIKKNSKKNSKKNNNKKNNELDEFIKFINDNDIQIEFVELKDTKNNYIDFKNKIIKSNLNSETKTTIISQIDYFLSLNESSHEYQKMKTWMNSLIKIPFDNYSKLPLNINSNNNICNFLHDLQNNLDNCIYGQDDAKESLLQIITQIITNPNSNGSIIALKGPPGVGKTSLIKNGLAKSLNLPFSFISLSGINDVSYFDGFSFTYEGSKYGKIIEILIKTQCMNPIIFMDELDKISNTDKGDDISNLLIHLTDFTQNDHYEDKYFSGIPLNLSKCIFIFSLNDENLINPILRNRLNIVNLKSFNLKEKIKITKKFIIPEFKTNIGINNEINFDDDVIEYIINNFTENEPGVRNLRRTIENILRKINLLKFSKKLKLNFNINIEFPLNITKEYIDELLKNNKINKNFQPINMMYL